MRRSKKPKSKTIPISQVEATALKFIKKERAKIKDECMAEVMDIAMPVFFLACKDELNLDQEKIDRISRRMNRYFGHLSNKYIGIEELHELMRPQIIND